MVGLIDMKWTGCEEDGYDGRSTMQLWALTSNHDFLELQGKILK